MNKKYWILAGIMFLLGLGLVFLPQQNPGEPISPKNLMTSLNQPFRYLTTDDVARRIIQKDPALLLIDVRDPAEYNTFSLPAAVNIPLKKILESDFQKLLSQKGMDVVFYSNGDLKAEDAWILSSRMGLQHLYIMKGGLNHWVETFFMPVEPPATAPSEVWATYDFRKAARLYFLGASDQPASPDQGARATQPKQVKPSTSRSGHKGEGC